MSLYILTDRWIFIFIGCVRCSYYPFDELRACLVGESWNLVTVALSFLFGN